MNNEMQQELLTRLDILAAKLGIAVDQLWEIFIAQAQIDAIATIASFILALMVGLGLMKHSKDKPKLTEKHPHSATLAGVIMVVGIIVTALAVIAIIFGSSGITTQLLNPDYYAWEEIRRILR